MYVSLTEWQIILATKNINFWWCYDGVELSTGKFSWRDPTRTITRLNQQTTHQTVKLSQLSAEIVMNGELFLSFLPHKSDPTEWNRHTDQAEGRAVKENQIRFI